MTVYPEPPKGSGSFYYTLAISWKICIYKHASVNHSIIINCTNIEGAISQVGLSPQAQKNKEHIQCLQKVFTPLDFSTFYCVTA